MAFSEMELKQIEDVVGELCRRRVPAQFHDKLRLAYSVKNHEVLIYEARPGWRNPDEWIEASIAKLRYVRGVDEWRLYWLRASGKWRLYEPNSRSKSLAAMVREIDIDSDCCFFG